MLALIKQERWARLDFNLPLHVKAISMKYFISHRSTDTALLKSKNRDVLLFIPCAHISIILSSACIWD